MRGMRGVRLRSGLRAEAMRGSRLAGSCAPLSVWLVLGGTAVFIVFFWVEEEVGSRGCESFL